MEFMKNKKKIGLILSILVVISIISLSKLGIKDGSMVSISVLLIIIMILLSKKDMKKSMYMFIVSMPILVTARKLFYLDLGLIKLNFESVMILYFFILNYKYIVNKFKTMTHSNSGKRFIYYVIFLIIASYASCFFSKDIMKSIALNTTSILVPTLLMITIIGVFEKSDIKNIVYTLIMCINLSCFYGFMQMLSIGTSLSAIKNSREYITFGYHNTNIFVVIALLIYPLILNELLYKKNNKKENIFLIASLLIQTMALLLTFSRGAWLSLGLVFIAVLFSKKYRGVFLVISILGIVSASTLLPYIMSRGGSSETSILTNQSTTARIQSIYTSVEIMQDNILGVGYGEFNNSYRDYAVEGYMDIPKEIRDKMRSPFYTLENAHNFFLHMGVELGIFVLASMILILINRIIECFKNYKDNRGIFIAIAMFIFIGITTGIELNHKGVLTNTYILWTIFALITLNSMDNNENKEII